MSLHPDKCVVIHFGRENPHHLYSIDGKVISKEEEVRDLGITISNSASQTSHINKIAKKGRAVLSQMKRTMTYRDSTVFASIYRTYVRPTLENCVQVWNPAKLEDIKCLEKVQKRALRMITDQGQMSYEEKLGVLHMTTLEERRARGDQIEVFKILNDLTNLDKNEFFDFVQDRHQIDTRNHSQNLLVPQKCRLNIRRNFFSCRVVNAWNSLPEYVRSSTSVNSFKNNYDYYHSQ